MTNGPSEEQRQRASDPTTPQRELADLAYAFPDLRVAIASNPSCYEGLRVWIAENLDAPSGAADQHASVAAQVAPAVGVSLAKATAHHAVATPIHGASAATGTAAAGSGVLISWLAAGAACLMILTASGVASAVILSSRISAAQDEYYVSHINDAESDSFGTEADEVANEPEVPVDPTVAEAARVLPSTCEALYGDAMRTSLQAQGAVLNPSWFVDNDPQGVAGTREPTLYSLIAPQPRLDCRWLSSSQVADWGIETTVAFLDSSEAAEVNAALAATGYRPLSELGGTRFVLEKTLPDGSGHYGESHIIVNNVWFATHWSKFGPKGYTADMVAQTFG